MRDRRSVDDLTIEELEQVLRIKRREARQDRLDRYERIGRRRGDVPLPDDFAEPAGPVSETVEVDPDALAHESYFQPEAETPKPKKRSLRDRLLLGVEVMAAIGLVVVLVMAFTNLSEINRDSAEALAQEVAGIPTLEPTPLMRVVVLPGGHTPPTSPGGSQPNYDEVPANLRPLVEQQFAGPAIVPTASPVNAIRIRIPAIRVDAPIVQGDGEAQLMKGVGQHIGTADPGEAGNMVLSAHNDIYGLIFRYLDQLQEGDEIIVSSQTQEFTYRVSYSRVVGPTDVSVMDPAQEPIITLISCYPYLVNSHRIVVIGELVNN